MASYEIHGAQKTRLGTWEYSPLGQDAASAIITSVGSAVHNVISTLETNKTLRTDIKARRDVAIITTTEDTKRLGISTTGAREQAALNIQRITSTYGSLSRLIVGTGIILMGLALAGGISYRLATKKRG